MKILTNGKKRIWNKFIFLLLVISIFLILLTIPFIGAETIDFKIDKNRVAITAIYDKDVSLLNINITDIQEKDVFYSFNSITSNREFSNGQTIFRFKGSAEEDWYFNFFNDQQYLFNIFVEDTFKNTLASSKSFEINTVPCDNDGVLDPGEYCDGANITDADCSLYQEWDPVAQTYLSPYAYGELKCDNCRFDPVDCLTCEPLSCDTCNNKVCFENGTGWTSDDYVKLCGSKDSDLSPLADSCDEGACDIAGKKVCKNGYWEEDSYSAFCSGLTSDSGTCTSGICDPTSNSFCDGGTWSQPSLEDYCSQCSDFDSDCARYENCTDDNVCDLEKNYYCKQGKWTSDNYCDVCDGEDSGCGIAVCEQGACDTCLGAKKYCDEGIWYGDGVVDPNSTYCDVNWCGKLDPACGKICEHGTCDFESKKYCFYGYWDLNSYCDKCKDQVEDAYCLNPFNCGDNKIGYLEACDGTDTNGMTCEKIRDDFLGGNLACSDDCLSFDLTQCIPSGETCGDNVINGYDLCDGSRIGNVTCESLGFIGGELSCDDSCTYNTTNCISPYGNASDAICRNGFLEPGEHCDGGIGNNSCYNVGNFLGGSLSCATDCLFDVSNCIKNEAPAVCGDGIINGPNETCDGTLFSSQITGCSSFASYLGGNLICNSDCIFDFSQCKLGNPSAHCSNVVVDVDESDIDCGGVLCPACENGKKCVSNDDCISKYCKDGICTAAACDDQIMNGIETDIDCGGACIGCVLGQKCLINTDCDSGFCDPSTRTCAESSCDDGYMNGMETDIDCGSVCEQKCMIGQTCLSSNDCVSAYCDDNGLCGYDKDKDTDGDGMPDYWEELYGLDPENPYDAKKDLDKDGFSNYDEYINDTDPTNPNDPFVEKKTLVVQIILLIIGIIIMIYSTYYLVHYRKYVYPNLRKGKTTNSYPRQGVQSQQRYYQQRSGQFRTSQQTQKPVRYARQTYKQSPKSIQKTSQQTQRRSFAQKQSSQGYVSLSDLKKQKTTQSKATLMSDRNKQGAKLSSSSYEKKSPAFSRLGNIIARKPSNKSQIQNQNIAKTGTEKPVEKSVMTQDSSSAFEKLGTIIRDESKKDKQKIKKKEAKK